MPHVVSRSSPAVILGPGEGGEMKKGKTYYLLAGSLLAVMMYYLFDPSTSSLFPVCPFKKWTGYDCAFCGIQRSIHSLLTGDIASALHYNLLTVLLIPIVLLLLIPIGGRPLYRVLYNKMGGNAVIIMVSALIIGWTLIRNMIEQ